MSVSVQALFMPLASLPAASIVAGYTAIQGEFSHPIRSIQIYNDTDAAVIVSFDGTTDHFFYPSKFGNILDISANREGVSDQFFIAGNFGVYVKQSGVPTTGLVWVSAYYGKGE